jgi:hypothetical protein
VIDSKTERPTETLHFGSIHLAKKRPGDDPRVSSHISLSRSTGALRPARSCHRSSISVMALVVTAMK